jgi:hypothetical protein
VVDHPETHADGGGHRGLCKSLRLRVLHLHL